MFNCDVLRLVSVPGHAGAAATSLGNAMSRGIYTTMAASFGNAIHE